MKKESNSQTDLLQDNAHLRARLEEAEETLRALRAGEVDALVVGDQVYSLKSAETPYRILIENMNEGAATLGEDGIIAYANRRLGELLATPFGSLVGSSFRSFVVTADLPAFDALLAQSKDGASRGEIRLRRPNEAVVWVQLSFSVLDFPGFRSTGVVAFDLTERIRADAELNRYSAANLSLEQQVSERTLQLKRQNLRLRQLADQLARTEQRERHRLAGILHDGLQQILVAGKMQLLLCQGEEVAINRVRQLFDEAIEVSRSLSYELSPPALFNFDLVCALKWLAEWQLNNSQFDVVIESDKDFPPLGLDIKTMLFDIVRELLLNSLKHSGSKSAKVELRKQPDDSISIVVADEGCGFEPDRADLQHEDLHSIGLFSIHERLDLLGGSLRIESQRGAGAKIHVTLPLASDKI